MDFFIKHILTFTSNVHPLSLFKFNYVTFLHLSLMLIVVEHVVSLPANLHTTTKLFHCLVAFSPVVNIIHRLVSFQSSLLHTGLQLRHFYPIVFIAGRPHWSSTLRHFCPTGLQHPSSHVFRHLPGHGHSQCFELN